jgi:hypothetical protein
VIIAPAFRAAVGFALTLATATPCNAQTWQQTHPRRAEVNGRLLNQNARIRQERREGEINSAQAQALHQQDHAIRGDERAMASQNGGQITRTEQNSLNQQENIVSGQIGR